MIVKWSFKFVLCVLTFLPALSGHVFTPPRDGRTVLLENLPLVLPRLELKVGTSSHIPTRSCQSLENC